MLPKSTIFTNSELKIIENRFWPKTSIQGPNECWPWLSSKRQGYGRFRFKNKLWQAHRIAWILINGPITDNLCICHHCDNRSCVNPAHLFSGTHKENTVDAAQKGRHKNPQFRGSKNAMSKLSTKDVIEIRRRHANGETQRSIAADFSVNYKAISKICRRQRWRHI